MNNDAIVIIYTFAKQLFISQINYEWKNKIKNSILLRITIMCNKAFNKNDTNETIISEVLTKSLCIHINKYVS